MIYRILLISIFILSCAQLSAQPGEPGNPNLTPLDGGASILIASGIAMGAAHYRKKHINKIPR